MTPKRTPGIEPDSEFEAHFDISKAYVDDKTGQRHIVGVASGVAEDLDGERASKSCIEGMIRDATSGGVKLTSTHQQDWWSEIGDVAKAEYDPATDEMIVDTILPPEGVDPLADKGWRIANTEKVGFSVGGKLLKSYFERTELGKKRKVLDAIKLRHIALTKKPAYPYSFAQAVAKTWDGEPPADDEFTLDVDPDSEVTKDTTGSWASGSSDGGGGNVGRDSVGSGKRNAGSRKPDSKGMNAEDEGDDDDQEQEDLPEAKQERHLACPNCGHEFAADLPVEPDERQLDDNDNDKDDADTGKSVETRNTMSQLSDTLDALKALAAADDVAKDKPETKEPEVGKTETEDFGEVAKLVAASHRAHEERFATIETGIGEAFGLVAKALKGVQQQIAELPQGRKSLARVLPPPEGHESGTVEKSVEKQVEEAPDAVSALKILNRNNWGVE